VTEKSPISQLFSIENQPRLVSAEAVRYSLQMTMHGYFSNVILFTSTNRLR
jgi:hypothetical protein